MKFSGLLIALLLLSCTGQKEGSSRFDHVNDKKNLCEFSEWLKIEEVEGGALIEILHPTDKKKNLVIGINSNKKVHLELSSGQPLGVFSTTHIGMLAELNALELIKATTDEKLIYNEFVLQGITNKEITSFSSNESPDIELLLNSGAKILVHSSLDNFPGTSKLEKFNVQAIPNYDWMESHPLGKAEWILLFGYLTGKQEVAKRAIAYIKQQYNAQKRELNRSTKKILMGSMIGDFWYAPAGNSFNAQFIKDAGGSYLFDNNHEKGSLKFNLEKVVLASQEAYFWINPGSHSREKIKQMNPKVDLIKPFNNGKIYCYSHNVNRYWEIGPIQPHLILSDMKKILQQKDLENLYFYKEIVE